MSNNKNKGFASVPLIIILVIIVIGGYLLLRGKSQKEPEKAQAPSEETTQAPTPITQVPLQTCLPTDPPSITVISPNGGETWTSGQQVTVTWTSCNVSANSQVKITLSESVASGEHTTSLPIIQSTPNDGSETFVLSATLYDYFAGPVGYPFKIGIGSILGGPGSAFDWSDNPFTIQ